MTNPDELQRRFAAPPPAILAGIALGILVLLGVGGLLARPAWRALKSWRAENFVAASRVHREADRIDSALEDARSALQLAPSDPDVLRLNAELLSAAGHEACLAVWQRLLAGGRATVDDRASFAEAALSHDQPELAHSVATNLEASGGGSARSARIVALLAVDLGQLDEATRNARRALSIGPSDPTNAYFLGTLLSRQSAPEVRDEGRRLLWSIASTNGPVRNAAFRQLARSDFSTRADRDRLAATLAAIPNRTPGEDVLLAEIQMQLNPPAAGTIASNLIARLPRDHTEYLSLTAEAMVRQARYVEALGLTVGDRSLLTRALCMARHDALVATGQTEEAYRLLLHPNAPIEPFELELLRVRAAQNVGDESRRNAHLENLVRVAGDRPRRLRTAAELAETSGAPAVAAAAWSRLATRPEDAPEALRRLQRLADRRDDTWTARDYARRALRLAPGNTEIKLELAYYDLLLGEELDRALAEAVRQLAERPHDPVPRSVVALAHLRLGAPAKAREVLDRMVVDDNTTRFDVLAVVTATYGVNGFSDQARELASRIPIARLRPEERDLIRSWVIASSTETGAALP